MNSPVVAVLDCFSSLPGPMLKSWLPLIIYDIFKTPDRQRKGIKSKKRQNRQLRKLLCKTSTLSIREALRFLLIFTDMLIKQSLRADILNNRTSSHYPNDCKCVGQPVCYLIFKTETANLGAGPSTQKPATAVRKPEDKNDIGMMSRDLFLADTSAPRLLQGS